MCAEGNNGVQCLLCGNRFASVKNMIKHQEKAHADEVRQHKERARAGERSSERTRVDIVHSVKSLHFWFLAVHRIT